MILSHDIILDETAFTNASHDLEELKNRADQLKAKLEEMYKKLTAALDTPAGKAIEFTAKEILIKPIDDLLLVIKHISATLNEIIGTNYYKDIFIKFEKLNANLKF